jgi:hypothetical protein
MRFRPCTVLLGAVLCWPASARAQVTVLGDRDLRFGAVTQGVPKYVPPSDPINSGEFEFTATLGSQAQVKFTLPSQLNGPAGATIPIVFGSNDAIEQGTGPGNVPSTFNPKGANVIKMTNTTRMLIFLGGTISPAANQRTGNYSAPVVMTVTIVG